MDKYYFHTQTVQGTLGKQFSVFFIVPKQYFIKENGLPLSYVNSDKKKLTSLLRSLSIEGDVVEDEAYSFCSYTLKTQRIKDYLIDNGLVENEKFTLFVSDTMWYKTLPGYYAKKNTL